VRVIWLVAVLFASTALASSELERTLFEFTTPQSMNRWQAVNDGVMGGVSTGTFHRTSENTLVFSGTLSLKNNGGFASIRSRPGDCGIEPGDCLITRVKGDGRSYILNLYTKSRRMAFSYRAPLPTTQDTWIDISVPIADFVPTSFGRTVNGLGPVDPTQIVAVGFMLSDKQPGPFQLEIESVSIGSREHISETADLSAATP